MKKLVSAIQLQFTRLNFFKTVRLLAYVGLYLGLIPIQLSAQNSRQIGMEYGVLMIPDISSSGTKNSNYSIGINSSFPLSERWSIGTGVKYLNYGSHTFYRPVLGIHSAYGEALIEKSTYAIQNLAFVVDLAYETKYLDIFISGQPEKALFGKQKVTQKILRYRDIHFEHYPQNKLKEYNLSFSAGLGIKRNFGDKISFSLEPSLQYFLFPFYDDGGFNEVKIAYHFVLGINYNLDSSPN